MVGSNLEVEIGSNLVEVLAGTEVAEETVVVLQLSVLLVWEWTRLVVRRMEEFFQLSGKTFPVGRKNFSCWKEKLFLSEGKTFSEVRPKSSQFSKI